MKQLFYLFLLANLLLFCSCGKEPDKAKTKKNSPAETSAQKNSDKGKTASEEEEILSAEEFSKSFSKPKFKNKQITAETKPKKEELPYQVDSIEKSAFDNSEYADKETPSKSLAGMLRKKQEYSWLPKWHFVGKGEVYLPAAAISEDLSLLAVVETVPRGDEEKKGSMIILINTYNWTVSRIHYFKEKLITKIFFIPGKRELLIWEEAQQDIKHRKIHKININTGEIESSSRDITDALSSMAVSPAGDYIFLKTLNKEKSFYVFEIEDLNKKPEKRKCGIEEGCIAVFNDRLILIGKDTLTTYKISFHQKISEIKNPTGNIPDVAVFAGADDKIAYSTYLKPVNISIGNQSKDLCRSAGRVMLYREDLNILAFEEFKNRQITFIKMTDFSEVTALLPDTVKPKTQAGALLFSYLPHHERYLVLDTHGTLSLYHKPGKKWRKQIIFSADKK